MELVQYNEYPVRPVDTDDLGPFSISIPACLS